MINKLKFLTKMSLDKKIKTKWFLLANLIFGILIALVCATQGYNTKGGAKDVGESTTKAAVLSTVYMLMADFLINLVFYL